MGWVERLKEVKADYDRKRGEERSVRKAEGLAYDATYEKERNVARIGEAVKAAKERAMFEAREKYEYSAASREAARRAHLNAIKNPGKSGKQRKFSAVMGGPMFDTPMRNKKDKKKRGMFGDSIFD